MRSALNCSDIEVRSENLLRSALLTWHSPEYIAPVSSNQPYYTNPLMAEAMELIGKSRIVTDDKQALVHELVKDLFERGVLETFRYAPAHGIPYENWPKRTCRRDLEIPFGERFNAGQTQPLRLHDERRSWAFGDSSAHRNSHLISTIKH